MFESTNHADGTLNLSHPDHIKHLKDYEREALADDSNIFDVVAVCGECAAHIVNGEEDHDNTPAELSGWLKDHYLPWVLGSTFYPDTYWTCEACRADMLEDAVILNDIQY